jgi:hypothetical protein
VQPADATGEHLQDSTANAAKMWSVQRGDEKDADGKVGGNGNDEGSKGIIIQRSRR